MTQKPGTNLPPRILGLSLENIALPLCEALFTARKQEAPSWVEIRDRLHRYLQIDPFAALGEEDNAWIDGLRISRNLIAHKSKSAEERFQRWYKQTYKKPQGLKDVFVYLRANHSKGITRLGFHLKVLLEASKKMRKVARELG